MFSFKLLQIPGISPEILMGIAFRAPPKILQQVPLRLSSGVPPGFLPEVVLGTLSGAPRRISSGIPPGIFPGSISGNSWRTTRIFLEVLQ